MIPLAGRKQALRDRKKRVLDEILIETKNCRAKEPGATFKP